VEEAGDEPLIRQLVNENRRLKERVFELEEKLGKTQSIRPDPTPATFVRKLLESKDRHIEQSAAELERTVEELRRKNELLELWMAALRLYQQLFDHDGSVMIGVRHDGRVVLYNKTAVEILGESVERARGREIEFVDFSKVGAGIPDAVRKALLTKSEATWSQGGRSATVFVLGEGDSRAALLRISGLK
jgi:PAS domain-containing protein